MITAFTDGSSRGNPGPGGWAAIVHMNGRVVELGGHADDTTNNRMELSGAINSAEWIHKNAKTPDGSYDDVTIKSDSKYVIQGITSWVKGWKQNGWKTAGKKDVGNRDLWEALDASVRGLGISWVHVDGHAGVAGNERCDEIATGFADGTDVVLYDGPSDSYTIDLFAAAPVAAMNAKKASKSRKTGPAYSYLSFVDGEVQRHATWAECEARVKGKRAKFKKAMSAAEEVEILQSWAV
ncbi:MAG: ribonuclease H [bacterium]|nr:ribonuclease H [bacterium]